MALAFLTIYTTFLAIISVLLLMLNLKSAEKAVGDVGYRPKTLVMVPCRGLDLTLKENLTSISSQKYDNYDIVCVIDSTRDSALEIIRQVGLRYILSDLKIGKGSGKVKAIASALKKFPNYEVYVMADSDVLFKSDWLVTLLQPLKSSEIGISTAYPFFYPVGGFWSKLKSVWGMVGESLMESKSTRFGWGGSLAFKKGLLDKGDFKRFVGEISDDVTLTKIAKSKSLGIGYIGSDKLTVNVNEDVDSFFEWSNRQTAISLLLGREKILYPALILYSTQVIAIVSALVLAYLASIYYAIFLLPIAISAIRNYVRSRKKYPELFAITLLLPFVYLSNVIIGSGKKQIDWRGKRYLLK